MRQAVLFAAVFALFGLAHAGMVQNGTNLNGTNLNGTNLNGTNLNGTNLNGTNLNGVLLGGVTLANVQLQGSELVAQDDGGNTLSGTDLIGAVLTGVLDSGDTLPLRIDDVQQGSGANTDVFYYAVSYQHSDGSWDSLCTGNGQNPLMAIPLPGRWDYRQGVAGGGAHIDDPSSFTFACQRAALAKCAEWGYKPWAGLASYHQTCTRVVRADYCGDGNSHTVDGQVINIYDNVGVQADTRNWLVEATWDENGARAYNLLNRSHLDLVFRLSCNVPIRVIYWPPAEFAGGAKIIDETPLQSDL